MAALPSLPPFNAAVESRESYFTQFVCYLDANKLSDIKDAWKRGLFLTLCGPAVFETTRSLMLPLAVELAAWNVLQERLQAYYAPKKSKIAYCHAFDRWDQAEAESISAYVATLRGATLKCQFTNLEDALMDQQVCGVRDAHLQRRLLAKDDLTLKKAIDEALAAEAAEKSSAEIRG